MTDRQARKLIYAVIEANKNRFNDDALEALEIGRTALEQPTVDVLEQIRAEIETKYGHCDICEYFEDYDYEENDISEYRPIGDIADILQIIDRHMKGESE